MRTSSSVGGLGLIRDEKDPLDHVNIQHRALKNAVALHTKYTEYIHRYGGSWLRPSRPRDKQCGVQNVPRTEMEIYNSLKNDSSPVFTECVLVH